jgi:hypothetical protein
MKKIIFTVLIFSVFIFYVNALDPNLIEVAHLGRTSREEFGLRGGNTSTMRSLFEAYRSGGRLVTDKFFFISGQNMDAEDREMINFVFNRSGGGLPSVRNITTDDTYTVLVFRTVNSRTGFVDGWFILTQPNTNGTWSYYLYYFSQHLR